MKFWLIKSEPFKYSWDKFVKEGRTFWDGVRNYQARNNLRSMGVDDLCLFYHSNEGKEVVGMAKVVKTAYQDPTTTDTKWVCVDVVPQEKLKKPVSLEQIKNEPKLKDIGLVRQQRLSVVALTREEFDTILELSEK
ncbi:MAG: EVE domain-containing protein [Bacteroidia bacterium]|nr:EVE domain-containing protein [Bacteroidia bacterium]